MAETSIAPASTRPLFVPNDVNSAYDTWGAACGPAAVAAICGLPVNELRRHFDAKPWANPSDVRLALTAIGRPHTVRSAMTRSDLTFPEHGLAFVQISGSWLEPGVPVGAAYRRTHWVAANRGQIFDINVGDGGGWVSIEEWRAQIAPQIVAFHKRADGWFVRVAIEVR